MTRPIVTLILTIGITAAAGAADWSSWRGPNGNGVSPEEIGLTRWPAEGPKKLWSTNIGRSYASVAVSHGRLYAVGTKDGQETLRCLEAKTGAELWKHAYEHPKRAEQYDPNPTASTGSPVAHGDRVYLLTREGLALCLDASKGTVSWSRDLVKETGGPLPPFGSGSSPLVVGDRVVYNLGHHGIALNPDTGAVLWNGGPGTAGHASPVRYQAEGQEGVLLFSGDRLMGVDLASGKLLWRHPWTVLGNMTMIDPIASGNEVLITGYFQAQLLRITPQGPTVVWDARRLRTTFSNPLLLDGRLYSNDRGALQCVDWKTGAEKWSKPDLLHKSPAGGGQERTPSEGVVMAAGKHLLALDDTGTLHLLDTGDTFHELAAAHVLKGPTWTIPTLANGLLYCHNNEGDLVCLDLRG